MPNDDSVTEVKCEYYVPMGKPGAFIIKVPIVLSNLKISIPIKKKIDLNKNCRGIKTNHNKVYLKNSKLNSNGKLLVNGYIHKSLKYSIYNLDKITEQSMNVDIPVAANVTINFDQIPICKTPNSEACFYEKSTPIHCSLDCIEILKDSVCNSSSHYYIEMIISLKLTLTQVQNVFIPEPEGNFMLLSDNSKVLSLDNINEDNSYCVVGYDPKKGLIANKIVQSD
ncbi:hypothetical protein [Clostridium uliginosum]|uniref:SipL SPOCS domain-containing protein n=1 Tax=Clostridium uliginosum TaxID=119641 RepID=A0A1I1K2W2_9CLOT|nr:hypothetical protein [Clostridium uliginosum]SFC51950.1 hypothetical protein SAMN05421842_104168 [Clostridium uliginosum]